MSVCWLSNQNPSLLALRQSNLATAKSSWIWWIPLQSTQRVTDDSNSTVWIPKWGTYQNSGPSKLIMVSYLNQTFCRELRGQVCNLETHIYYMYTYFAGVKCCCHFVWLLSWAKKTMAHKNAGCNITVGIIVGGWNPAPHWYAIAINIPWFGRPTHHVNCFRGFCPSTIGR